MQLMLGALLAMAITMLLIPLLVRVAPRLGLIDRPGGRKQHAQPTPRIGGIAMAAGMLAAMLTWRPALSGMEPCLVALPLLLLFGMFDDRKPLPAHWKLAGQLLAALIVMQFGGISIASVRHAEVWMLPQWLSLPLTLGFIVGVTNAFNMADGLDGLAGGMVLLCLSGLLLLALSCGNLQVAFLCAVSAGATLGFLRFNTFPARIFMGDTGSQLLGFSAAIFSLRLTQDLSLPYSAALPLLLLGVPVMDTLAVMTERLLHGRSPFAADRLHLHYRLLDAGFGHHEAVMVVYLLQALLLVLAWQLRFASDLAIAAVFVAVMLVVASLLHIARRRQWQLHRADHTQLRGSWQAAGPALGRWTAILAALAMAAYAIVVAAGRVAVPLDVRLLAFTCVAVLALSLLLRRGAAESGWLDRAALYLSVLIMVVLGRGGNAVPSATAGLELLLFAALGVAIAVAFYRPGSQRGGITPLDLLVLLVAIAVPNLPGSLLAGHAAGWLVAKALLLLYGVECVLAEFPARWRIIDGAAAALLICIVGVTVH